MFVECMNYSVIQLTTYLNKNLTDDQNEAGAAFDNSFFDNSFGFLRQFKNRSFLDPVFSHATGRMLSCLTSINSVFDFWVRLG